MTIRKALSEKILVLGIDGMDPRMTSHFLEEGKLPNIAKLIARGTQRKDLVMLGGHPTITPPLWTSLATGSSPMSHGITCFWRQHPEEIETLVYNLDSRLCQDEQVWNIFAEAGKKTLVWHWPGSSWPPTSDSPNLHVVDGTQPGSIHGGNGMVDMEKMCIAKESFTQFDFKAQAANETGAGCVITDLPEVDTTALGVVNAIMGGKEVRNIMLSHEDGELSFDKVPFDVMNSPIKAATGWTDAPPDAKEFIYTCNNNLVRRHGLILKNEQGIYDAVALYQSKKSTEPMAVLHLGEDIFYVTDHKFTDKEGNTVIGNYMVNLLTLATDGSDLALWIGPCMNASTDYVWHPKSLYKQITENVGYVPTTGGSKGINTDLTMRLSVGAWDKYCQWQAASLNYLIKENDYDVIISHLHNVDAMGHNFWYMGKSRPQLGNDGEAFMKCIEAAYVQTDQYVGEFLHLLEKDYTILITSDHGLIITPEDESPLMGDAFGCNVMILRELGFAALVEDENGNPTKEIDWANTKALAPRGNHIYLNIKGRNPHGIVDPADQYQLESDIISGLYNYRLDGKRVIALAMRNKEAAVLGMGGPECGDIIYFVEEGFNRVHGDAMSTFFGTNHSSVSPIFIAAGKGIKKGATINRAIRTIDFAPTLAALGGIRMPADCEGSPVYQIFEEEF